MRASSLGTSRDTKRKALETEHLAMRAAKGESGGMAPIPRTETDI